ncbi:hypothetical protein RFI_21612 [Reticulomyxa filosa]|uniref:Uncharacterized protein n=1 Tax=Reticulomyxa filosa TaxID=46433 RepID=X6MQM6_RETFI|nr:hypothetical protein RFI_21612 [Reticulomyxa filosa]|eukprot:ETO15752.1 hypothetical protein RFI_21612 [Reticulomyxa filosa]
MTEQAMWCVDMLQQWIWGGSWIEVTTDTLFTFNLDDGDGDDDKFCNALNESKLGPKVKSLLLVGAQIMHGITYRGLLRYRWYEAETIHQGIQYVMQALKNINLVDNEGLRIIENDHCAMILLETLVKRYHTRYSNCIRKSFSRALMWKDIALLREYHDIMLHSRQAPRVLWRWYHCELAHATSEKKRAIAKQDTLVEQLLQITKSAIHLRFVWKHLVRYRQDLLDEFLDSGEAYRGVF